MKTQGDLLTVTLVEDIQNALEQNISVEAHVNKIKETTLSGIIEYLCLQKCRANVPRLPESIWKSKIGSALNSATVVNGHNKLNCKDINVQEIEFCYFTIADNTDCLEEDLYLARFFRSALKSGFCDDKANLLGGAFGEMIDNAIIHSETKTPILAAYCVCNGVAQFCVADLGIGILKSLQKCPDYEHLRIHKDAIREALKDGVTRFGAKHGGLGFRAVFKALASQWGHLRFRSGEGCVIMDGTGFECDRGIESYPPFMPGFQVYIACRAGEPTNSEEIFNA